jgi:hypothetical protein
VKASFPERKCDNGLGGWCASVNPVDGLVNAEAPGVTCPPIIVQATNSKRIPGSQPAPSQSPTSPAVSEDRPAQVHSRIRIHVAPRSLALIRLSGGSYTYQKFKKKFAFV